MKTTIKGIIITDDTPDGGIQFFGNRIWYLNRSVVIPLSPRQWKKQDDLHFAKVCILHMDRFAMPRQMENLNFFLK